jgi:multiple sugar transport system substrate-binding protein
MRLVAAACALTLVVAGCSSSNVSGGTVSFQLFGDAAEITAYKSLIEAFAKVEPNIDVDLIAVPNQGDHIAKLATDFSGGSPPDLFLINYRRFGQFAGQGVLEPLGARLETTGSLREEAFYPEAIDAFRFDGDLMCLPQNISSQVVYYNPTLFERFDVANPAAGWTWDDFLATARRMTRDTDRDGKTDVYGIAFDIDLVRVAPFIWQAGGEVVDDVKNPTRMTLDTIDVQRALAFVGSLRRQYRVTPTEAEEEAEDPETRFSNKRLAMFIDSRRATTTLREVDGLTFDVAPLPRDRVAANMLHSDAYCMARDSKNKDAAFKFVEFALGKTGAELIAKTGRTVPSLKAVAESPAFLDPGKKPASAQVFLDNIALIKRFPNIETWNEIESKVAVQIYDWYYSTEEVATLIAAVKAATRGLFSEAAPRPS